jgi:hypothetical protein
MPLTDVQVYARVEEARVERDRNRELKFGGNNGSNNMKRKQF